jgi:NCAIR mutase (PurE)-related protein
MDVRGILEAVHGGTLSVEDALERMRGFPTEELATARIDHQRRVRQGYCEVIYGPGKTVAEVAELFDRLAAVNPNVLATRVSPEMAQAVLELHPEAEHDPVARVLTLWRDREVRGRGRIVVVTAGTSDVPVAREAVATARVMGNEVAQVFDVGVAGLHRLMEALPILQEARVLIVVAGMEGALPSVVGGLVTAPIIAVPTSTGYGASFHGLAALLAMLNACASGITVVNIDNGFGAGFAASLINR